MLINLEKERKRLGINKEELCKSIGISLKTYYNWINKTSDIPSVKLLELAKLFGTSMELLLDESYADKNRAEVKLLDMKFETDKIRQFIKENYHPYACVSIYEDRVVITETLCQVPYV